MEQSRRDFLKGAGLVAAGAASAVAAAGVTSITTATPALADEGTEGATAAYTCDVVIAGAGIGGLAAAVAAAETGANVILVEASNMVGGTSRFAAGAFGPRFGADWAAAYAKAPMSDPELGQLVCDLWAPYLEWIDGLGLVTEELAPGSPYVWMGGKRPEEEGSKSYTDEYLQQFGQIFTDLGGTTLLGTRAKKLVTNADGAVVGLIAEDANGPFEIAAGAVILATGGWQCDKEKCTKYIGRHADLSQAQCIPYLDGSGIKMGVEVGAQLSRSFGSYYGHPQPWPMTYLNGIDTPEGYEAVENIDDVHLAYYGTTEHSIQGMGIYVNTQGKRFVNEGLGSSLVNQEVMQQPMARAYLILDEGVRNIIRETPFCNAAVIGGDRIDHMIEYGMTVVQADTIEDLGQAIIAETADGVSFNAANMVATVTAYNEAAEAGTAEALEVPHAGVVPATPLVTPPFYAIPVVGGIMATFGGLKINTNTEVIGTDALPIQGLYAIPGTAGGIMNGDYWCVMSGYSVLGRLSGETASAYAIGA